MTTSARPCGEPSTSSTQRASSADRPSATGSYSYQAGCPFLSTVSFRPRGSTASYGSSWTHRVQRVSPRRCRESSSSLPTVAPAPRWRVRVESRPHVAPTAHDSDDSDEDDTLFADLQARVAADPQILRQVAKMQEEGGTWDDLAALGRLISSDPTREPAAQTPITIAVDGRPEKFVVDPAGHGRKASGLVVGCTIALSIDGMSFNEVALQQILDPLSFLYPGHAVDGNAPAL